MEEGENSMCLVNRRDIFDLWCPVTFSGTYFPEELVSWLCDSHHREVLKVQWHCLWNRYIACPAKILRRAALIWCMVLAVLYVCIIFDVFVRKNSVLVLYSHTSHPNIPSRKKKIQTDLLSSNVQVMTVPVRAFLGRWKRLDYVNFVPLVFVIIHVKAFESGFFFSFWHCEEIL